MVVRGADEKYPGENIIIILYVIFIAALIIFFVFSQYNANDTNDGGSNLPTASKDVLLIKIDCQPMSIPHPGIFFSCLFFIFHILARISV